MHVVTVALFDSIYKAGIINRYFISFSLMNRERKIWESVKYAILVYVLCGVGVLLAPYCVTVILGAIYEKWTSEYRGPYFRRAYFADHQIGGATVGNGYNRA